MAEMMINGDNLIRYCMERRCGSVPIERIKSEPRIEVERVRHARWINNTFCSDCKRFPVDVSVSISNRELTKYFSRCPHCGAKMDATDTNVGGKGDEEMDLSPLDFLAAEYGRKHPQGIRFVDCMEGADDGACKKV